MINVGEPHRQIVGGQKIPHEVHAMLHIRKRMPQDSR